MKESLNVPKGTVICHKCNHLEYEGSMIWYNGKQYCRRCTYERWDKEYPNHNYEHTCYPDK